MENTSASKDDDYPEENNKTVSDDEIDMESKLDKDEEIQVYIVDLVLRAVEQIIEEDQAVRKMPSDSNKVAKSDEEVAEQDVQFEEEHKSESSVTKEQNKDLVDSSSHADDEVIENQTMETQLELKSNEDDTKPDEAVPQDENKVVDADVVNLALEQLMTNSTMKEENADIPESSPEAADEIKTQPESALETDEEVNNEDPPSLPVKLFQPKDDADRVESDVEAANPVNLIETPSLTEDEKRSDQPDYENQEFDTTSESQDSRPMNDVVVEDGIQPASNDKNPDSESLDPLIPHLDITPITESPDPSPQPDFETEDTRMTQEMVNVGIEELNVETSTAPSEEDLRRQAEEPNSSIPLEDSMNAGEENANRTPLEQSSPASTQDPPDEDRYSNVDEPIIELDDVIKPISIEASQNDPDSIPHDENEMASSTPQTEENSASQDHVATEEENMLSTPLVEDVSMEPTEEPTNEPIVELDDIIPQVEVTLESDKVPIDEKEATNKEEETSSDNESPAADDVNIQEDIPLEETESPRSSQVENIPGAPQIEESPGTSSQNPSDQEKRTNNDEEPEGSSAVSNPVIMQFSPEAEMGEKVEGGNPDTDTSTDEAPPEDVIIKAPESDTDENAPEPQVFVETIPQPEEESPTNEEKQDVFLDVQADHSQLSKSGISDTFAVQTCSPEARKPEDKSDTNELISTEKALQLSGKEVVSDNDEKSIGEEPNGDEPNEDHDFSGLDSEGANKKTLEGTFDNPDADGTSDVLEVVVQVTRDDGEEGEIKQDSDNQQPSEHEGGFPASGSEDEENKLEPVDESTKEPNVPMTTIVLAMDVPKQNEVPTHTEEVEVQVTVDGPDEEGEQDQPIDIQVVVVTPADLEEEEEVANEEKNDNDTVGTPLTAGGFDEELVEAADPQTADEIPVIGSDEPRGQDESLAGGEIQLTLPIDADLYEKSRSESLQANADDQPAAEVVIVTPTDLEEAESLKEEVADESRNDNDTAETPVTTGEFDEELMETAEPETADEIPVMGSDEPHGQPESSGAEIQLTLPVDADMYEKSRSESLRANADDQPVAEIVVTTPLDLEEGESPNEEVANELRNDDDMAGTPLTTGGFDEELIETADPQTADEIPVIGSDEPHAQAESSGEEVQLTLPVDADLYEKSRSESLRDNADDQPAAETDTETSKMVLEDKPECLEESHKSEGKVDSLTPAGEGENEDSLHNEWNSTEEGKLDSERPLLSEDGMDIKVGDGGTTPTNEEDLLDHEVDKDQATEENRMASTVEDHTPLPDDGVTNESEDLKPSNQLIFPIIGGEEQIEGESHTPHDNIKDDEEDSEEVGNESFNLDDVRPVTEREIDGVESTEGQEAIEFVRQATEAGEDMTLGYDEVRSNIVVVEGEKEAPNAEDAPMEGAEEPMTDMEVVEGDNEAFKVDDAVTNEEGGEEGAMGLDEPRTNLETVEGEMDIPLVTEGNETADNLPKTKDSADEGSLIAFEPIANVVKHFIGAECDEGDGEKAVNFLDEAKRDSNASKSVSQKVVIMESPSHTHHEAPPATDIKEMDNLQFSHATIEYTYKLSDKNVLPADFIVPEMPDNEIVEQADVPEQSSEVEQQEPYPGKDLLELLEVIDHAGNLPDEEQETNDKDESVPQDEEVYLGENVPADDEGQKQNEPLELEQAADGEEKDLLEEGEVPVEESVPETQVEDEEVPPNAEEVFAEPPDTYMSDQVGEEIKADEPLEEEMTADGDEPLEKGMTADADEENEVPAAEESVPETQVEGEESPPNAEEVFAEPPDTYMSEQVGEEIKADEPLEEGLTADGDEGKAAITEAAPEEIEEDVKESSPHTEVKEIIVEDTKTNDPNRASVLGATALKDLVSELITSKNLETDSDKVRAIFFWICTKNLDNIDVNQASNDSPDGLLVKLKSGRISYAHLFTHLCQTAGLDSKIITGYAKGAGYVPGMKLTKDSSAVHSWNVAMVDGKWKLFDCHWAARRLVGRSTAQEHVLYCVDEFYYMPDPNHLKWTHHPFEEEWQLTVNPLTLEEFHQSAPVKSSYFKYNIELLSHPNGLIQCSDQLLKIRLGYPGSQLNQISFTMSFREKSLSGQFDDSNIKNYCMHEQVSKSPPIEEFTFRFPRNGTFMILIYVRDVNADAFGTACEYLVQVNQSDNHTEAIPPFPMTEQTSYGPTELTKDCQISCDCLDYSIFTDARGKITVHFFSTDPNKKLPQLIGQLYGQAGVKQTILANTVMQYPVDDKVAIVAILPQKGEFALEVYAHEPGKHQESQFFLVWQFLIDCIEPTSAGPVPTVTNNIIGPLPAFTNLGLNVNSIQTPLIEVVSDSSQETDFKFTIDVPSQTNRTRVVSQLLMPDSNGADEDVSHYVMQHTRQNEVECLLRFPGPGFYKLHMFAQTLPDKQDVVPLVCTYMFQCNEMKLGNEEKRQGFPTQTYKWKEGGVLLEPINRFLNAHSGLVTSPNQPIKFSMLVADATEVIVLVDKNPICLLSNKVDERFSRWEGTVDVPWEQNPRIRVAGRWKETKSFLLLLEYKVSA